MPRTLATPTNPGLETKSSHLTTLKPQVTQNGSTTPPGGSENNSRTLGAHEWCLAMYHIPRKSQAHRVIPAVKGALRGKAHTKHTWQTGSADACHAPLLAFVAHDHGLVWVVGELTQTVPV